MELVKYNNELNELRLKNFTPVELDILMVICSKIKNSGSSEVILDLNEMKKLIGYNKNGKTVFIEKVIEMNTKLQQLQCRIETKEYYMQFVLFTCFKVMKDESKLIIKINPEFVYLLNNFSNGCWTKFSLEEFVSISSKYAKNIFRCLRQYKSQGWWKVSLDEFRVKLDIPDKYESRRITDKIIRPAIKELESLNLFNSLSVSPVLAARQGHALEGYLFEFEFSGKEKSVLD